MSNKPSKPPAREPFAIAIRRELPLCGNSALALQMKAYMREQFDFLGVQTPRRRALTVAIDTRCQAPANGTALMRQVHSLWALPQREFTYVAIDYLKRHQRLLDQRHIEQLLTLAQKKSWWDSVDGLASVIGTTIKRGVASAAWDQGQMDAAILHPSMWIRRIAMIHQLGWRAQTDTGRLFGYARRLAHEQEFFIQKAIGWALRDYARHDPGAVREFLRLHGKALATLSVREASKHLR